MLREKQLQALADIVGEDYFSSEEYMRHLYSYDIASLPGIVHDILNTEVEAVAQPTTSKIVSNLMKYCRHQGIPIIPRGHGTSGYGGVLPTNGGIVVEMTRMNKVENIDRTRMTVEVGAGIIWANLLEILEEEKLTVAAYPSSAPSSTVGGWVAAGGSGIGSTKYGGIREQVVDLEVVLPDGRIIRTRDDGEKLFLKKDGYTFSGSEDYFWDSSVNDVDEDVTGLFVDSNGTLGIITKVVLKIMPLQEIKPLVASFKTKEAMSSALDEILKVTKPFYLHFITDNFYRMLVEVSLAPETKGEWLILCTFEGSASSIAAEVESFEQVIDSHYGTIESEHVAHHEWEERFYPMRIKRLGPSLAPSEVYVPVENLLDFFNHVDSHFKGESFALEGAITDTGEAAILAWFLDDERRRISFLMGWYRSLDFIKLGIQHEGRAYSIGMWNNSYSRAYFGKEVYRKIAKLKKQTDPKNKINPGKVFSGPLRLSPRFNFLVMGLVGIAAPIVLWFVGLFVPGILEAYGLSWLIPVDLWGYFVAFVLGLVVGAVIVEFVNIIPVSFILTFGGPFMRLGRKIFH